MSVFLPFGYLDGSGGLGVVGMVMAFHPGTVCPHVKVLVHSPPCLISKVLGFACHVGRMVCSPAVSWARVLREYPWFCRSPRLDGADQLTCGQRVGIYASYSSY